LRTAPPPERDATVRLAAGLFAYDEGRYAEAFEEFVWVARGCHGRTAGVQAMAALAALELDPRNPVGRPGVGTELLAELILDPRTPDWLRPVATTTYLLGLGLGAPAAEAPRTATPSPVTEPPEPTEPTDTTDTTDTTEPTEPMGPPQREPTRTVLVEPDAPVYGCGPALPETATVTLALPSLPGPSLIALLVEAETQRELVEGRAEAMEAELTSLRQQLAEARGELERIRRTLRP
jgi:hypothetical protein